jgi:transcriptional regulator with XRE-family HTH domain
MEKPRRGPLRGANRRKQELLLSLFRAVREEKGLHQTDVAGALGRPQSFVSKYEAGARRLDLLELKDVCDAVGIELTEFVRRFEAALDGSSEAKRNARRQRRSRLTP